MSKPKTLADMTDSLRERIAEYWINRFSEARKDADKPIADSEWARVIELYEKNILCGPVKVPGESLDDPDNTEGVEPVSAIKSKFLDNESACKREKN